MASEVVERVKLTSADDLRDLLTLLGDVLKDAGMSSDDLDVVLFASPVHVNVIRNTLTDRSVTFDLTVRQEDVE